MPKRKVFFWRDSFKIFKSVNNDIFHKSAGRRFVQKSNILSIVLYESIPPDLTGTSSDVVKAIPRRLRYLRHRLRHYTMVRAYRHADTEHPQLIEETIEYLIEKCDVGFLNPNCIRLSAVALRQPPVF